MQRSSFEYRQLVTNYYSIVRNIINAPLNSHDFIRRPLKSLRLCRTIGVVRRSRKRRCISWKARDISEVGERSFDEAAGNARNRDRVTYLNTTRRVLAQFYAAIGERCAGLFTATGSGRREEKRRICRSYGNRAARQAQPVSRKKKRKKKGKEREEWTRRKNAGKEKKTRRDRDARSKVNDGNFRDRRLVRVDAPTNGKTMRCKNRICTPASTVFDRRRVVDSPADYHGS